MWRAAVMNGEDTFDRILALLQDATLDMTYWPAFSALIDEACATNGNSLIVGSGCGADVQVQFARFYQHGQRSQDLEREYFEVYHPQDERLPRLRRLPDSRLVRAASLYDDHELKTSAVYNEWMRKIGSQNGLNVRLDGPGGSRIVWSLGDRTAPGGWSSTQTRMLEHLLPHLRQLVSVWQAFADAEALGASLTELLEITGVGIIHLDPRGRVLETNDLASAMLRRGDGLSDPIDILTAWAPADNMRLQKLLTNAIPHLGGPAASGSLAVRRASGLPRLLVHVLPVGTRHADAGLGPVAVLVLVVDPVRRPQVDPMMVSRVLNLTTGQGQVAALLAQGRSIRDIATATNRQENTVYKHLKETYKKLGISRQADLARLVLATARFSPSRH